MVRPSAVLLALALFATPLFADEARDKAIHDATVLVDQGKLDEAIAALKKLAADDPTDSVAAYELGLAYAAKGDSAKCRSTLEPVLDMKGADRRAVLVMLGNCLDQMGEHKKAIERFREALKLAPDSADVNFNLAVTLVGEKQLDEAREVLKHDVEKNPWHASAHYVLGYVFQTQGHTVPALLSYLHFLALEPASGRSATAAQSVRNLLNAGYEKTEKGANITFDPNARKDEGDYGPMQLMMAMSRASADQGSSELDILQSQIHSVLAVFLETAGEEHSDFTARVQVPFFQAMKEAKVIDVFGGIVVSSLKLPGTTKWAKANEKAANAYFDWVRPQLKPSLVVLPK